MALIAFDARDAFGAMPHGSGIYVRRLLEALTRRPPAGHELWPLERGGRGPELWWEQITLPRLLRARRAGLVHSPDSFLPLRRDCPGVVTVHDLGFEEIPDEMPRLTGWKYRVFVSRAVRSADRVICPSQFTADDVTRRYGVSPDRLRVIPEAPALADSDVAPAAGDPYLLAVGDLRPKKNLARLIEAYRRLRRAGLPHRLLLAGADDAGAGATLRRLAGSDPVELLGFVPDARLDALLRDAEALVVPSLYEGFGLVVLDAMRRGCPVVLARAGALPETGGDAAAYFDPLDPADMAGAIRQVVEDRSWRDRLCEAGRARAAQFSWERTAAETIRVYEELLG
ncbi:MAG TPA: glycosyltransferase family 1 protein [Solirubrobacteraceae bacterium]